MAPDQQNPGAQTSSAADSKQAITGAGGKSGDSKSAAVARPTRRTVHHVLCLYSIEDAPKPSAWCPCLQTDGFRQKLARNQMFPAKDGSGLMSWGHPIHSYRDKTDPSTLHSNKRSLAEVNAVNPRKVKVYHQSERSCDGHPGWNRPVGHKYHFLSLPRETRDRLYELLLTVPEDIMPETVPEPSNMGFFQQAGWHADMAAQQPDKWTRIHKGQFHLDPSVYEIESIKRYPKKPDGRTPAHTAIHNVLIARIDATILRTCKQINQEGCRVLYGQNSFAFTMTAGSYAWKKDAKFDKYRMSGWDREMTKTAMYGAHRFSEDPEYVGQAHRNMHSKDQFATTHDEDQLYNFSSNAELLREECWTATDPFLRFLRTIGPVNAKLIRNLTFNGMVVRHKCFHEKSRGSGSCPHGRFCVQSLAANLHVYAPTLVYFCTGVFKMTVFAFPDPVKWAQPMNEAYALFDEPAPPPFADLVRAAVEDSVFDMKNLQTLVLKQKDDGEGSLAQLADISEKVEAQALQRWKTELANAQKIKENEEYLSTLTCGFCKETGHVWANCYNLCSLCGGYGHLRDGCPEDNPERWGPVPEDGTS